MPAALTRACPLCGSAAADLFLEKQTLRLCRCRQCAMVYVNPVAQDLAVGTYYDQLGQPFYLSPEKLASDYASVRFERELALFTRFCPAGRVLDVGCSTGAFLFQLNARHPGQYEIRGTDVSRPALEYARSRGVTVIERSFLEHDFGDEQFDALCFWAVMEHLAEPRLFLEKAARLLRPSGHCFILVPNLRSLATRWLGAKYRYIFPQHLNYFSRATLEQFAASVPQLEIATVTFTHFNPVVIWQDARGMGEFVSDENRAALLQRTTALKTRPWLKPVKLAYRGCEALLASLGLADNVVTVLRKTK